MNKRLIPSKCPSKSRWCGQVHNTRPLEPPSLVVFITPEWHQSECLCSSVGVKTKQTFHGVLQSGVNHRRQIPSRCWTSSPHAVWSHASSVLAAASGGKPCVPLQWSQLVLCDGRQSTVTLSHARADKRAQRRAQPVILGVIQRWCRLDRSFRASQHWRQSSCWISCWKCYSGLHMSAMNNWIFKKRHSS